MKYQRLRTTAFIALLILFVGLPIQSANASTDDSDIRWQRYDVTIDIQDDGSLRVTELMRIEFDGTYQRNEQTINGEFVESIEYENVDVRDGDGNDVQVGEAFAAESSNRDVTLEYTFKPTDASDDRVREIEVTYTVTGAIRVYDDTDSPMQELRWRSVTSDTTAIGAVESATLTVNFPEPVSEGDLVIDPEPSEVTGTSVVWTSSDLSDGDSQHGAVRFPAITGAVKPNWQDDQVTKESRQDIIPGVSGVLALVSTAAIVLTGVTMYQKAIREPKVELEAEYVTSPPSDLPAPLAGALVDESVEPREITAGLLDLERIGAIEIRENPEGRRKTRFILSLVRPLADIPAYHHPMIATIFGESPAVGDHESIGKMEKLSSARMAIGRAYELELQKQGFYASDPRKSRLRWAGIAIALALVMAIIVAGLAFWVGEFSTWLLLPTILTSVGVIVLLVMAFKAAVKTEKGIQEAGRWQAYKRYVDDLRKRLTPAAFIEQVGPAMPWAVALTYGSDWEQPDDDDKDDDDDDDDDDDQRWRSDRRWRSRHPIGYGGYGRGSSGGDSGGGGFSVQGASNASLGAVSTMSASMYSLLNSATNASATGSVTGSTGGSGGSGGFSGGSSSGSSGGSSHSFS